MKTSVTIDEKVLRAIDRAATRGRSRSQILEDAAREYLTRQARAERDARDRELLDQAADALKHESSIHCDALVSIQKAVLTSQSS